MNWTGGSLQRTKYTNKGVIQKQKAYFAKARTQLQQSPGVPTAPFQPDYLQDNDDRGLGHQVSSFGSGLVRQISDSRKESHRLGNCGTTPRTRRLRRDNELRPSENISPHLSQGERSEVESSEYTDASFADSQILGTTDT